MKKLILIAALFAFPVFAQTVQVAPDCFFFVTYTATASAITNVNGQNTSNPRWPQLGYANKNNGCVAWTLTYFASGVSALSFRFDSAADNAGVAGTWGAFTGTIVSGVNPNTSTTNAFTTWTGYNPWVSTDLTSVTGTGTIQVYAYGCRSLTCAVLISSSSGVGTNINLVDIAGSPVVSGGPAGTLGVGGPVAAGSTSTQNPVVSGGVDGSGSVRVPLVDSQGNQYSFLGCNSLADVALSGTSYTEIVAGTASQVIRVCKIFVTSSSGGNPNVNTITVASATVTTCASPTELLNGAGITGIDSDFGGALRSATAASICVKETVANADHVTISYAKAAF